MSSDSIDVHSEELVYRAARAWLDYDPTGSSTGGNEGFNGVHKSGDRRRPRRNGGDSPPGISYRDYDNDSDGAGDAVTNAAPSAAAASRNNFSAVANGSPTVNGKTNYDVIVNGSMCSKILCNGNENYDAGLSNGDKVQCQDNGVRGSSNGKIVGANDKMARPYMNGIPRVFAECTSDDENDRSTFTCTLMSLIRVFTIPAQVCTLLLNK